ncbi:3',5'-cyclic-nucleotide phosphodiesterase [uncultured Chitinophaga sp.]|jgi:Low-affinity cAMP phosphodiesterase|uniref:MBL fold metallo-hydrolase n=1 Tax=uncultured Chitinophaga sp. TaxID=339340 RepID=UPI0026359485|nr:3',5'-cyclic-nucleotide phosphodiesterase [uncultured Chitinophaga sp.]
MNLYQRSICLVMLLSCMLTCVQAQTGFRVVPLGVKGGMDERNLSAYMVAPQGSSDYICLDAGTLYAGIRQAIHTGSFNVPEATVLRQYIKGYFISHPHLDHLAGMIINSPEDSAKDIYGLPHCLDIIKEKYFSWKSWANFADEGEAPLLKKYHYHPLTPGAPAAIAQTDMSVQAFPLSHSAPYQSTAFLVRYQDAYLLYLGDTGADTIEHSDKLRQLWQTVAPLVRSRQLKAIFIEVSFPDEQPQQQLFGHLTPALLMQEMQTLGSFSGTAALKGLPVVITHIKPAGDNEAAIRRQLTQQNNLQLKLIIPEQGKALRF